MGVRSPQDADQRVIAAEAGNRIGRELVSNVIDMILAEQKQICSDGMFGPATPAPKDATPLGFSFTAPTTIEEPAR